MIANPTTEAGLTLVEMLIVLAILGVVAGAATLSIGAGGGSRVATQEARRLAQRLRLAADDVRIAERPLAFAWDARGYGFVDWDAARRIWVPDTVEALARHDLPSGMTLGGDVASPVPIAADGSGPPIVATLAPRGAAAWIVRFDGLDAVAAANGAP